MQIFALWPKFTTATHFQVFASTTVRGPVGLPDTGRLAEYADAYREWLGTAIQNFADNDPRFILLRGVWLYRPLSDTLDELSALDVLDVDSVTDENPAGTWCLGEARAFLQVNVDGSVQVDDHGRPLPLDALATVVAAEIKRRQQLQAAVLAVMSDDDEVTSSEATSEPTSSSEASDGRGTLALIAEAKQREAELGRELTSAESRELLAKHGWGQ